MPCGPIANRQATSDARRFRRRAVSPPAASRACAAQDGEVASLRNEKKLKTHLLLMSALLAAVLAFAVLLAVPRSHASGDALTAVLYKLPWTGGASYPVIQDYSKHGPVLARTCLPVAARGSVK
jgi:hypothetical protein